MSFMQVESKWKERFEKLKQKVKRKQKEDFCFFNENQVRVKSKKELWQIAQRKIEKVRLYWKLLTKKSK